MAAVKRAAGVLALALGLLLVSPALARVSPATVLQLAQDAAREGMQSIQKEASSVSISKETLIDPFNSILSDLKSGWGFPDAAPVEVLGGDPEPWFCHGIDCPAFEVDTSFTEIEGVERRIYEATKWVSIRVTGVSYDKAMYKGFMALFRYISGSNGSKAKIPMTAPVKTKIVPGPGPTCEDDFIVSFFVPHEFQDSTPEPSEEGVFVEESEPFTVYVFSYGGRATEESILTHATDLAEALAKSGIDIEEDYFFSAGYDPPFRLFHRHNEVWLLEAEIQGEGPRFGDAGAEYDLSDVNVFYATIGGNRDAGDWDEYLDEDGEDAGEYDEDDYGDGSYVLYEYEDEDDFDGSYTLNEYDDVEDDYTVDGGHAWEDKLASDPWGDYDNWEYDYEEGLGGLERAMRPCSQMQQDKSDNSYFSSLDAEEADTMNFFEVARLDEYPGQVVVLNFELQDDQNERGSWPRNMDDVLDDLLYVFRLR